MVEAVRNSLTEDDLLVFLQLITQLGFWHTKVTHTTSPPPPAAVTKRAPSRRSGLASIPLSRGQVVRRDDIWPAVKVDGRHASSLTRQ